MILQKNSQLVHLVQLLDDTDARMQEIVHQQLLNHSLQLIVNRSQLLPQLSSDALERLHRFFLENRDQLVLHALQQLLHRPGDELDLEKSMTLLSFWNDPLVDYQEIHESLNRLAAEIATFLPSSGHPLVFLDHINFVFFNRYKFQGNQTDYYNADNLFIDRVLKTRKGLPVSLGIVYLLIAQRLQLPIFGVSMPMHFLLKFYNGEDEIFFDVFNEGKIYSREECLRFLHNARHENPEGVLKGAEPLEIFSRVLKNLRIIYASYYPDTDKHAFINDVIKLVNPGKLA